MEKEDDKDFLIAQLADFGFSTHISPSDTEGLVFLPESKPWTIPPGEYHHRGFTLQNAMRSMAYSLGVVSLWLLFYNYVDDPNLDWCSDTASLTGCAMFDLSNSSLQRSSRFTRLTEEALKQFFRLALAVDPKDRTLTVIPLLQALHDAVAGLKDEELDLTYKALTGLENAFTLPVDEWRYHTWQFYDVSNSTNVLLESLI